MVLDKAIENGDNIMWETTGSGENVNWIIDDYIKEIQKNGYQIILAIPLVKIEEIIKRCAARKQASICTKSYILPKKIESSDNFETIANNCDRVFIYDNNKAKPQLIYDSDNRGGTCVNSSYIESNANIEPIKNYMQKNCKKPSKKI